MDNTRRDLLMMGGGAAAGLLFTPVPWKLVDDVSIWTQNWSWLPTPARGEITSRYSVCTLCNAGCAVKARCVNGHPFSLAPVPDDPVSRGSLCALGFGAHQMPFGALRLRSALRHGQEAPADNVISGAAKVLATAHREGLTVAVLDQRPGRMISLLYRRFLAGFPNGRYLVPPQPERGTPDLVALLAGTRCGELGYDFENSKTILSVSSPLLDGWGTPGRMIRLWAGRGASGVRFLHAEPRLSRTAALADRWLPIHPGSEAAFALGLARVLVQEKLAETSLPESLAHFSLEQAVRATGLSLEEITQTARELAANRPAVIVGGGDAVSGPLPAEAERAIVALNLLLGSVGTRGGMVERRVAPGPPEGNVAPHVALLDVPPKSIDVLLLDSASSGCSIAEPVLRSKLAAGATVIQLAPYRTPWALEADFTIAVPAPFESIDDVPTPPDAVSASWAAATPLYPQPDGIVTPDEALSRLAAAAGLPSPGSLAELLPQKAAAIAASGRGRVVTFSGAAESEDLSKKLAAGAVWVDDVAPRGSPLRVALPDLTFTDAAHDRSWPLQAAPAGWRGCAASIPLPPLSTKLTRESHLRSPGGEATLHPRTAREAGVANGESAVVETPSGSTAVTVHVDPGMPPDLVELAVDGQNADATLALFAAAQDGCWRLAPARVRRS